MKIQLLFLVLKLRVFQNSFIKDHESNTFRIPMLSNSRSLNLSNAVAIIAYEAWKV